MEPFSTCWPVESLFSLPLYPVILAQDQHLAAKL